MFGKICVQMFIYYDQIKMKNYIVMGMFCNLKLIFR